MRQRKSPRAQRYDYTSPGGYFITICTKDRVHYFGEIENGKMMLNDLGKYATEHRNHISRHYPIVDSHEFICMPNHIHGILIIRDVGTQFLASDNAVIRGYKIGITKYANQNNITFARQGRYHDHIIRNEDEYNRIKHYIQTNPENRESDSLT